MPSKEELVSYEIFKSPDTEQLLKNSLENSNDQSAKDPIIEKGQPLNIKINSQSGPFDLPLVESQFSPEIGNESQAVDEAKINLTMNGEVAEGLIQKMDEMIRNLINPYKVENIFK